MNEEEIFILAKNIEEEIFTLAKNTEKVILPKLKYLAEESGDGTIIHDANNHISRIDSSRRNAEYFKDISRIVSYREYLISAENWLIKIAGGK